ncbi:ATP-binding cassette domain-containing protein [Shimia sagamensis]|uniref:ATP-binding cassette, subfamily C/ATP-binding cassette, subfamily C, exporter for protease/lipase n=1 Tax=Shimia sagamensis TaxID=1566352 RepID=A0ABY1PCE0_9RHOB|nr:ATP-binding cassette domain-containing protein [Shimia sagamensis]SMP30390.1 ATP-binding cassette, subfamily C/ATP-binding cassette, subfamily C, exporter for protease/lipase [Shimia sagamensis]
MPHRFQEGADVAPSTFASIAPLNHMRRLIFPLLALSAISNLAILVSPIFMMQVLDRVLPTGNTHTLILLLGMAALALLLQAVVDTLRDLSLQRTMHWCERLCAPVVLSQPSNLQEGLLTSVAHLKRALAGPAARAALSLPWLPVFTLVLWVIHPWFAGLAATLIAIAAAIRLTSNSSSKAIQLDLSSARNQEMCTLKDAQSLAVQPAITGLAHNVLQRFVSTLSQRSRLEDKLTPIEVTTAGLETFLRNLTQLLGLSVGAALVVDGSLSAGGMIAASLILTKTVASFEAAIGSIPDLIQATRGFATLQKVPAMRSSEGTEIADLNGSLRCEGVIFPKGGGAPPRLDRITFDLPSARCLAIVGASGSGKTTLLEALAGVVPCPIGTVWLGETEIRTLPQHSQAAHIGYLPQQAQLYHGSLAQNICGFASKATDAEIITAAQTAGVHGLISALPNSYDTDIGATPFVLSAGQKQRVALARAIFHRPSYLFLDEPNALLDAAGERQLCAALARLKNQNTTIVMVIHRSGLMGLADHVLALESGRIADFGLRSDVLGRMSGGRRRLEVPLQPTSLQDLADWIGAQFNRSNDADLCQRAELVASELFNLAMASGPNDAPRTAVYHFKFLNDRSCEITLTENRVTQADQKMQKVSRLLHQSEAPMADLPRDEAALAVLTLMSDGFDVENVDGQAVFRAAISTRPMAVNRMATH